MTFDVPGYDVDRLLGTGSQGEVWLGRERASGARVALKLIAVDGPASIEHARREASLLSALDHPNLIGLREFLVLESALVLVLELAEAGSLAALLRRRDRLTPAEVVAALSPVAAALAHAHERGVLHGDVSPANILFTAQGMPMLADLGVAGLLCAGAGRFGTPAYLDPSIAAGGVTGTAADVFSLAAVGLHALTGYGPWLVAGTSTPSAEQVLQVAATGRVIDLPERLSAVPPGVAAVIERGLVAEPLRRCTAAEFALDLRAACPPAPVVLAGGRIIGRGGRHSADHRVPPAASARPSTAADGASPDRDPAGPEFIPADLTRVVRQQVRAAVAAEVPDRRARVRLPRRVSTPAALRSVVALSLLALIVTAGVLGWPLLHRSPDASAGGSGREERLSADRSAGNDTASSAATPATSASDATTHGVVTPDRAGQALAALRKLDGLRAQAYAQRRPELLDQVYSSNALLAGDRAQLTRSVPPGCVLVGLSTGYSGLRASAQASGALDVQVDAQLPPATLTCPGQPVSRTAGVGPVLLVLVLRDTGAGLRIASQRQG
jgi:hypothetical protein